MCSKDIWNSFAVNNLYLSFAIFLLGARRNKRIFTDATGGIKEGHQIIAGPTKMGIGSENDLRHSTSVPVAWDFSARLFLLLLPKQQPVLEQRGKPEN